MTVPKPPPVSRERHVLMVSLESLRRTAAAGNHIEAVRSALATHHNVTVAGDEADKIVPRYLRTAWRFLAHLRRADIGYVRHHPLTFAFIVLLRLRRVPIVLELNGPPSDVRGAHGWARRLERPFEALTKWSIRWSGALITPTNGMATYVSQYADQQTIDVIPAGFDDATFRPPSKASEPSIELHGTRPYVAFVGANTAWQGVADLVAAQQTVAWPSGVDLRIVGDFVASTLAPESPRRDVDLIVLGRRTPTEVASVLGHALSATSPKIYQQSDPSQPTTGQAPLKVYEAMGCGVPSIVTDVPDQNRLIGSTGGGVVVDVGDSEAIARAVAAYIDSPELRSRHAAAAQAAAGAYSWTALGVVTSAVVDQLLGDAPPS